MKHYILRKRGNKTEAGFTVSTEGELDREKYPANQYVIMRQWEGNNNIATLDHIQPTEYIKSVLESRKKTKEAAAQEVGTFDDVYEGEHA